MRDARRGCMLKTRILTALVLVPAVLAALFLMPPLVWALTTLALIGVAAYEWARLTGFTASRWAAVVGGALLIGLVLLFAPLAGFARGWPNAVVPAFCGIAALFWVFVAPLLPMLLLGWIVLVGAWVALVDLQARSPWLVLAAMAIVWIADTAAYFSGRAFGRRRLAPLVSPGKTWEGVYGAWVAVALYALALVPFAAAAGFGLPSSVPVIAAWVVFVVLLASVSVIGDLFESLLKRHADMKDSGTLLPGHGGVLDRIDALLAAMPLAALAAHVFLARA